MTPNQILKKKVDESLRALRNGEKATVKELISELTRAREDINKIIRGTARFEMGYYRAMLRGIDEKINEYRGKMNKSVNASQEVAFKSGENLVPEIMKGAGYTYVFGKLSDELIVTAKELSVDYIKDMTSEMRKDIARRLRQGLLKGENNYDVARGIDEIIGTSKRFGYLNRADIIARMEINRAYDTARQAKDEESAKILPGLKNQWKTGFNPRPYQNGKIYPSKAKWNHEEVDGQVRTVGEPFLVSGEELMRPRDPNGSAENICGCNCVLIPYIEEWPE